jgi:HK97 family phage major capsid protein
MYKRKINKREGEENITLTEIIEQKNALKEKIAALLKLAEDEARELTAEEQAEYDGYVAELEELENREADKEDELRNVRVTKTPEKRFSLLNAIRNEVNRTAPSDFERQVLNAGREEMRKANLPVTGNIVLPVNYRASIQATVTGAGIENVPEDKLSIISKLRNKLVLVEAGAQFLTGLVGDVSIPVYSGSNVGWVGEIATATDAGGTFTEVNYTPKRLTANLKISKQFLLQDAHDAEALLQQDLVTAISEKLESTLLGTAAGSATTPAGLANGVTPTTVGDYTDIVGIEGALEGANVYNYSYLLSPTVKAALRTMPKDTGSGLFVYDNGEVSGYAALSSNGVPSGLGYLGDWSSMVICQWGSVDLLVDPYTLAAEGQIRIVVNTYFDGKPRRKTSFQVFDI